MKTVARLIDEVKPSAYRLQIAVDLEGFVFSGREVIEFELVTAARIITFHALGLKITEARLEDGLVGRAELSADEQTATLQFGELIPAGKHTLELEFSGGIGEGLHGFYRSQYEHEGEERWLGVTQFEPVHAREAFVCIDEPAAKAVFELSLTIPAHLTAISNTDVVAEKLGDDGRKTISFAPTPRMSTYLLAYLVGEFEGIEAKTTDGVTIRALATPGKQAHLQFALNTAVQALSFFTEYFGIAYPLPKLDMIAVPDFAAGAMENWGAVTYRETDLLLNEAETSLVQKRRVFQVVVHELTHQWFGNLVTMAWWDDLWLNEGFAAWAEYLAEDRMAPEWGSWTQFVSGRRLEALTDDALANTHPIEVPVNDPRALDEIFDNIAYAKGASIINMLQHYLGAEDFRLGLSHYLKTYQFSNATTEDLWRALDESSGKPVSQVMEAWTKLPGYPVIEFDGRTMRQRRFYASPREAGKAASGTVWPVPMNVLTPDGESRPVLMTGVEAEVPESVAEAAWFKPNPGQTGVYRVRYTPAMLQTLKEPMTKNQLGATDRYGVVDDVLATAEAGLLDTATALGLLATMRDETNYIVWERVIDGLNDVIHITQDDELRRKLEGFGLELVQSNLRRLGWQAAGPELVFDRLLRPKVLEEAIRLNDADATAEALERYQAWLKGGSLDSDLRPAILYAAARHGGTVDFEALVERYRVEPVPQMKRVLLRAISSFRQPELVLRSLEFGLSKAVRSQDTVWTLAYNLQGRESSEPAWQFLQDQWRVFLQRYGAGGHMLSRIPAYIEAAFATHQMAEEVKRFFERHPHPVIMRPVAQAVEVITLKADWYERDQTLIEQFVNNR